MISKEFSLNDSGDQVAKSTTIKWKEGMVGGITYLCILHHCFILVIVLLTLKTGYELLQKNLFENFLLKNLMEISVMKSGNIACKNKTMSVS